MRVIFSRKGFDSAAGGCPSPIIEGKPISLPIPTRMPSVTCFGDLSDPIPQLIVDLTKGRLGASTKCHLDPDLAPNVLRSGREVGWRGALGQVSTALSHLRNCDVSSGDLFLFWGLFRSACQGPEGTWKYHGSAHHRIFGWLQVDRVIDAGTDGTGLLKDYPWLKAHPHARARLESE